MKFAAWAALFTHSPIVLVQRMASFAAERGERLSYIGNTIRNV
jgi:hypothetical protein